MSMGLRTIRAGLGDTVYAYRGDHVILAGPATVYHAGHATVTKIDNWDYPGEPIVVNTAEATRRFLQAVGVIPSEDGAVTLYKALSADMVSGQQYGRTTSWEVGCTTVCDDWDSDWVGEGRALHLSASPMRARQHYSRLHYGQGGTVYACRVPVDCVRMLPRDLTQFRCREATVTEAITARLA